MTGPNDTQGNQSGGENLYHVVEATKKVDVASPQAKKNSTGMDDGYGNFIHFNDHGDTPPQF